MQTSQAGPVGQSHTPLSLTLLIRESSPPHLALEQMKGGWVRPLTQRVTQLLWEVMTQSAQAVSMVSPMTASDSTQVLAMLWLPKRGLPELSGCPRRGRCGKGRLC